VSKVVIHNFGAGSNQIYWSVIKKGFVVINSGSSLSVSVNTALPAGTYCNLVYARVVSGACSNWPGVTLVNGEHVSYTVSNIGQVQAIIGSSDKSRVIALSTQTTGTGVSAPGYIPNANMIAVTWKVTHNAGSGDSVYVAGNFNNWDPCNALLCTWATGNIWTCGSFSFNPSTSNVFQYKPLQFGTATSTTCANPVWYSGSNVGFNTATTTPPDYFIFILTINFFFFLFSNILLLLLLLL